jgi:fibro-slime domain-containing protein
VKLCLGMHLMNSRVLLILASGAVVLGSGTSGCTAGPGGATEDPTGGDGDGDGDGDICIPSCGDGDGDIPNIDQPPSENCGDGLLDQLYEACDDGNNDNGDGCWGNCLGVEPGYICREQGQACVPFARCGDGVAIFPEQCDDGNRNSGDGCSNNCKVELGWKCEADQECTRTTCGDGIIEGAEMCEVGEDGCTSQCQFAPDCSGDGGACTSECGDGLVLGEECDDGNRLNGDGCDDNCEVEDGYTCALDEGECERGVTGECILRVPATFRDFNESHTDFQAPECAGGQDIVPGIVQSTLTGGKPVSVSGAQCSSKMNEWYTDVPGVNTTLHGEIVLYETGTGQFVNRFGQNGEKWTAPFQNQGDCACAMAAGCEYDGTPLFFPVDSLGTPGNHQAGLTPHYGVCWKLENSPDITWHTNTGPHNFHFTSEVRYWFPYDENTNASLEFIGDDDLWVFVNGRLAVDVGGIHPPQQGSMTLTGASENIIGGTAAPHGMTIGNVYEVKVFHAERRTEGSTFKLTLSGFNSRRSDCTAVCGDGIIGFGEECDDGVNAGGYNECGPDCILGAYCGDGIRQENEACDDNEPNPPAGCSGCKIIVVR